MTIEYRTITHAHGTYDNATRRHKYHIDPDLNNREKVAYITKETYESYRLSFRKFPVVKFKDDLCVYFTTGVTFSREAYREMYPKSKITYNPAKADVIIVNSVVDFNKSFPALSNPPSDTFFENSMHLDPDTGLPILTRYACEPGCKVLHNIQVLQNPGQGRRCYNRWSYNSVPLKEVEIMEAISTSGKAIMDVSSIPLVSDVTFTEDAYNSLDMLLKSNSDENMVLAASMLTAFDYESSKYLMAMLVNRHSSIFVNLPKAFVRFRTVLNRLIDEFDGLLTSYRNADKFYWDIYDSIGVDPFIRGLFSEWLYHKLDIPFTTPMKMEVTVTNNEGVSSTFIVDKLKKEENNVLVHNQEQEIPLPGEGSN